MPKEIIRDLFDKALESDEYIVLVYNKSTHDFSCDIDHVPYFECMGIFQDAMIRTYIKFREKEGDGK